MEEITTRFEIVRLSVKMADHETIAVQAKKLQALSLDEDLNEIIALLENRNYRQALFFMKGYVSSLDDSFFEDSPLKSTAKKQSRPKEEPREEQGLFDMVAPQAATTINLDDMLRMEEKGASQSVAHPSTQPQTAQSYVAQAKAEVEKHEGHLDTHKHRAENKTIKPFEEAEDEALAEIGGAAPVVEPSVPKATIKPAAEESPEPKPASAPTEGINPFEAIKAREVADAPVVQEAQTSEVWREKITEVEAPWSEGEEEAAEPWSDKVGKVPEPWTDEVATDAATSEASVEEAIPAVSAPEEAEDDSDAIQARVETEESIGSAEEAPLPESPVVKTAEQMVEEAVPEHPETPQGFVSEASRAEPEISLPPVIPVVKKIDTVEPAINEMAEETALKAKRKEDYTQDNRQYPPISYIDQKFRNMRHQFPQVAQSDSGVIEEVKVLLQQVATQGYTENDINDAVRFFQEKKAEGELAKAAQMLLLAAASESKYAQLLLARELFKGEVLKVDYPEAFTQINRLAEHDYPEAICDLAQLYEYGYGIKKDKKTAQLLYEEAAEMGVERAQRHVERLSNKKSILSSFFK